MIVPGIVRTLSTGFLLWMLLPSEAISQARAESTKCSDQCLEKKALLGDGELAYQIGNSFLYQNREEMMRWYRISAENGSINGQYNFAHFLVRDSSGPDECYRAIFWFGMASKHGHKEAKQAHALLKQLAGAGATFKNGCAREYGE